MKSSSKFNFHSSFHNKHVLQSRIDDTNSLKPPKKAEARVSPAQNSNEPLKFNSSPSTVIEIPLVRNIFMSSMNGFCNFSSPYSFIYFALTVANKNIEF